MKLGDKVFFDTTLFVYFLENNPTFYPNVERLLLHIAENGAIIVTSVVSLAEFGVYPVRFQKPELLTAFDRLLLESNIDLLPIDRAVAERACQLRAKYLFLKSLDAFQLAAALHSGCFYFATNDLQLKRIEELEVLILSEY